MFDINAIVNAAIAEAVNSRITEVLQQHADIVAALAERIAALEDQAIVTSNAIDKRITALENNPAQGVDTQAAPAFDKDALVEHLDNQEWFWEKLQNRIDSTVEAGIDDHCQNYDHDSYDDAASKVYETDFDDFVTRDSVREEIEDVLNNATLSLSI